ncbi:MAG TPA: hypothetical protein VLX68_01810 [Chitinivibrionales bacterium]|nr:hypothetical protein [Chitinivibrionales bacterium]
MKRVLVYICAALIGVFLVVSACGQTDSAAAQKTTAKPAKSAPAEQEKAAAPSVQKTAPAPKQAAAKGAPAKSDTLIVVARITEIPGKFASNDLYNYVYIMKYRVLSVVKGSYKAQDILVGHYNPLIPRSQIKDAMKKNVSGTVEKMEVGAKHKLWLITPIDKIWKDNVEDEYQDSDLNKYYAVRADIVQ